jgi:hypothetical protein
MRFFLKIFLLFSVVNVFSQNSEEVVPTVKIDSLYREDQFYFGFTLNTLQNKPVGLSQNKFSPGFSFGFLRDMPVNKKRTIAIAPGLGFAINSFNQNLAITLNNQKPVYEVVNTSFSKNRISNILVELPIEFRWRTSTYESYKFWRIYGGFKLGYLLYDKSVFVDSQGKTVIKNNKDFDKIQYGAYISSGYNSINVYLYYGLNPLFKSAKTSTESIDMKALNIGIMFYIL